MRKYKDESCIKFATGIVMLLFCAGFAFTFQKANSQSSNSLLVVPRDIANLQDAIAQVADGGIIEMQAGLYQAPAGGFRINNLTKSFVIRAALGSEVILDGGGNTDILRMQNSTRALGKLVTFENLTFANGRTGEHAVAGAVTLHYAEATFQSCIFKSNNGFQSVSGGGAVAVALDSNVRFYNSKWLDNNAQNEGGGLAIQDNSSVEIYGSEFRNNRVNLPSHRITAAGGAIHVGNSKLYVFNSLFENNRAGYVGGAIYGIGNWTDSSNSPSAFIYVINSTFRNNAVERDPGINFGLPTEGGALHAEDQTTAEIYSSTFEGNFAHTGGAVNLYRAIVKVENSLFRDNRATGIGAATGFGAAISAVSNDTNDTTTNGGAINRRSAQLTVNHSIFTRNSAAPSQAAFGIYIAGDGYRMYGQGGVAQNGNENENRAKASISSTIFHNTDVQGTTGVPGTGIGGSITGDLADISMTDIVVTGADAVGDNSSGGAITLLNNSLARMNKITIANSSSQTFGGAMFIQGSTVELNDCSFIANEISPGVEEPGPFNSYGAAIFASVDEGRNLSSRGYVSNCLFSQNIGLPIFDDDRNSTAVNAIQYNSNQFYTTFFNDIVYVDPLVGASNVNQLNSLVVDRTVEDTQKSTSANSALQQVPITGLLLTPHSNILLDNNDLYYLAYAWSGDSATLDGQGLLQHSGMKLCSIATCPTVTNSVKHSLDVDGQTYELKILSPADLTEKVYLPVVTR